MRLPDVELRREGAIERLGRRFGDLCHAEHGAEGPRGRVDQAAGRIGHRCRRLMSRCRVILVVLMYV